MDVTAIFAEVDHEIQAIFKVSFHHPSTIILMFCSI
jgi:hypothetical protein